MDQKFGIASPVIVKFGIASPIIVNAPNRYILSRNGWKLNVQRNNV